MDHAILWINTALRSLGGLLSTAGARLETITLNPPTIFIPTIRALPLSWSSIPDLFHGFYIVPLVFVACLLFIFGIPVLFDWLMGIYLLLPPVDLPSIEGDFDDEHVRKAGFIEEDVKGLLVGKDGEEGDGRGRGKTWECVSAGDGNLLGYVRGDDCEKDVRIKVRKARDAQEGRDGKKGWKDVGFEGRRKVLKCLEGYILREHERICEISCQDTGKVMLDAYFGEIVTTLEKLRWVLEEGEKWLKPEKRSTGPLTKHKEAWLEFWPLGVIGAIAPWNYPFHNCMNPVIAALFAGNAVVIKPSEYTFYSSVYFARIVRRALTVCGYSPELMQILIGGVDVGEALVKSDIDKLFFTGSTKVGKMVAVSAAERLLPVVLELGGKDAYVVCDDANIDHAVDLCMRGVYQNSGQNCIGVERVFVQRSIKEKWLGKVLPIVSAMRVGVDMGAMTMGMGAIKSIQDLVDDAVRQGAKVLKGGKQVFPEGREKGAYYAPTVLDGVSPTMRIAQEEVFGPVMCIYDFDSDDELCENANNCRFGLSASVFSRDRSRANHILSKLQTGMGNINDFGMNYLCQSLPFGGTKDSGSDRFAGVEGLRGCSQMKSVTRPRPWFPAFSQPPHFKYPISGNAYHFAAALNDLMFNTGLLNRIDNARNLMVMSLFRNWRPRCVGSGWA